MSSTRSSILSVLSYLSVVGVGIALLLSWIFQMVGLTAQVVSALNILAEVLAYIVVACYSFGYARRRGGWWLAVWVVAVVLIVVFLVLGNLNIRFK
ncbi:MAG: hypothetical protein J6B20_02300 [Clostridia bacterium]|nr:hypothetical protein [Clostridia bacterium]